MQRDGGEEGEERGEGGEEDGALEGDLERCAGEGVRVGDGGGLVAHGEEGEGGADDGGEDHGEAEDEGGVEEFAEGFLGGFPRAVEEFGEGSGARGGVGVGAGGGEAGGEEDRDVDGYQDGLDGVACYHLVFVFSAITSVNDQGDGQHNVPLSQPDRNSPATATACKTCPGMTCVRDVRDTRPTHSPPCCYTSTYSPRTNFVAPSPRARTCYAAANTRGTLLAAQRR